MLVSVAQHRWAFSGKTFVIRATIFVGRAPRLGPHTVCVCVGKEKEKKVMFTS
jgi:hypothetical protein